jgi:hypothetical protein
MKALAMRKLVWAVVGDVCTVTKMSACGFNRHVNFDGLALMQGLLCPDDRVSQKKAA